ncbi:Rieske (2Fe-2S) protein [Salipiger sp.]|uniref:Rieske (2Fe-2S) protein n=1 Tax=Salipiger sp. TaxID=2078585 RepID=UPI003A985A3B
MAWTDYSTAPAPGTRVCDLETLGAVAALTVETDKGAFPLLVARDGAQVRAYVNACPHQYLPLNYRGDQLLSADGQMLLCSAHGARFDLGSGEAIDGADCGLDPVPVTVVDGTLVIAG